MKERQVRILELILVVSITFLPAMIRSLIILFTDASRDYSNLSRSDYVIWIVQSILSISLMFYILYKNNRNYSSIGLKLKFEWIDFLIAIGLIVAAGVANAVIAGLLSIFSTDFVFFASHPQNIGFIITNYHVLLFILIILIPLQEELIVRGFTMSEVFNLTNNKKLAIFVSVGIQFTYHLYQGLPPAVFMLPLFIILSVYFVRTGNLNPVIYSHFLIDLVGVILKY